MARSQDEIGGDSDNVANLGWRNVKRAKIMYMKKKDKLAAMEKDIEELKEEGTFWPLSDQLFFEQSYKRDRLAAELEQDRLNSRHKLKQTP